MKLQRAFTLIELLIVIAIIGILASVAYPSYQTSVRESHRADAKAALMGFAQAMEQFYTINGTYVGAAADTDSDGEGDATGYPTIFSTKSPQEGANKYYDLIILSATSNTYLIVADPLNTQAGDGILILSSTGARGWDSDASGLSAENEVDTDELCWETSC